MSVIPMRIDGLEAVQIRDNLWGTFAVIRGGQNVPDYLKRDDDEFGPYAVYVKQWVVKNGSPHTFRKLSEPITRLILCGPRKRAETVMRFEATKYKQYSMITYRGEDF
jgi:hypothetical protein